MATTTVFRASESLAQGEVTGLAVGYAKTIGPASYAAGGFAIDLATDEGLSNDPFVVICDNIGDTNGVPGESSNVLDYIAVYDYSNKKLIVYDPANATEVSDATNLSAVYFRLFWMASNA